jgi:hypothetical protein
VLAVVDDDQHPFLADAVADLARDRDVCLGDEVEPGGERTCDPGVVPDAGQVDEERAVGMGCELARRDLDREACLAAPTGAGEGDQARLAQERAGSGELLVASTKLERCIGSVLAAASSDRTGGNSVTSPLASSW